MGNGSVPLSVLLVVSVSGLVEPVVLMTKVMMSLGVCLVLLVKHGLGCYLLLLLLIEVSLSLLNHLLVMVHVFKGSFVFSVLLVIDLSVVEELSSDL